MKEYRSLIITVIAELLIALIIWALPSNLPQKQKTIITVDAVIVGIIIIFWIFLTPVIAIVVTVVGILAIIWTLLTPVFRKKYGKQKALRFRLFSLFTVAVLAVCVVVTLPKWSPPDPSPTPTEPTSTPTPTPTPIISTLAINNPVSLWSIDKRIDRGGFYTVPEMTDHNGKKYYDVVVNEPVGDKNYEDTAKIIFTLNGNYTTLTGTMFRNKERWKEEGEWPLFIRFYLDTDKELYDSIDVKKESNPYSFNIPLNGVNKLIIEFDCILPSGVGAGLADCMIY